MPTTDRIFLYRFLPDEIRAFFLESGLGDVEQIAKTYGLSSEAVDEMDRIQQEVLFGYESLDGVRNLLKERLKFDEKLAGNVAMDLIEKRFLPIDSYLGATAFRTFANLGGNPTVANVKRIDATGGTVADVRRRVAEYAAQVGVTTKPEPVPTPPPAKGELEGVIQKARETTKAFDTALDRKDDAVSKPRKGEAPALDPTHELAAPRETVVKIKPLAPKPSFPAVEEEAEVAVMMKRLQASGAQASPSIEHGKIDEVQRRLSLTFPSAELDKRFRVLLGARLSNVRSSDAFKSALGRSVESGGLELDAHTVSRIIEEVEGHKEVVDAKAVERQKQGKEEYVEKRTEQYHPTPVIGARSSNRLTPSNSPLAGGGISISDTVRQPKKSEAKAMLSKPSMTPAPIEGKRPVVDVAYERRLVGPLEELARMTLADFRRLPGGTADKIAAIKEDVEALRGQDPGLRIRAVEAWRGSPLMRLYQKLLARALQEGVPVERVLSDPAKNPDRVQAEEIVAIRNFNKGLRS